MTKSDAKTKKSRVSDLNRSVPPTPEMLVKIKEGAARWKVLLEEQRREMKNGDEKQTGWPHAAMVASIWFSIVVIVFIVATQCGGAS